MSATPGDKFGYPVAISGDGNTIAVGAYGEDSNATGVGGDGGNEADDSVPSAGAAYVFVRSGGAWSQEAYVKPSTTSANAQFGSALALSDDGNVLAVTARQETGKQGAAYERSWGRARRRALAACDITPLRSRSSVDVSYDGRIGAHAHRGVTH